MPIDRTQDRLAYPPAFPLSDLLDVVKSLTHVQAVNAHRPSPTLGQTGGEAAWIKGSRTFYRAIGVDEVRSQPDPADPTGNTLQTNVCGNRLVGVSLRCECLEASLDPVTILERFRWGLRTLNGFNQLSALGLSIADMQNIQHLGLQVVNKRELLVAVLDCSFNWTINWIPPSDDGTTIGSVDGGTQYPGTPPTIRGTVGT